MRCPRVYLSLLVAVVLFVPALPAAAQGEIVPPVEQLGPPGGYWNKYPPGRTGAAIPKGKVETYYYVSSVLSYPPTRFGGVLPVFRVVFRPVNVYTPPGYTTDRFYPVLYLMHGRFGTYEDWVNLGNANIILDNLLDQKLIDPMIVVMPENYCSLQTDDSELISADTVRAGYLLFEQELLIDLVPWVDANFSTIPALIVADFPDLAYLGARYRALAGLSEGAEQALKFGTANPDTFARIGAFSPEASLVGDHVDELISGSPVSSDIWISCGNIDVDHLGVFYALLNYPVLESAPSCTFNILAGPHDWTVWQPSLYYFARHLPW